MIYKVKNPFVLNHKTFLPGAEVDDSLFLGQESIKNNFVKIGFLLPIEGIGPIPVKEKEQAPVTKPLSVVDQVQPKKINIPQAVEVKNDADLKKVVEETPKPENKPIETKTEENPAPAPLVTPVQPTPKKQRGRIDRSS